MTFLSFQCASTDQGADLVAGTIAAPVWYLQLQFVGVNLSGGPFDCSHTYT